VAASSKTSKVAIITGAAGGFGLALVRAFVEEGYRVGALDIDGDGVLALEQHYGRDLVLGIRCDISDANACADHVGAIQQHFGSLHVLVNNGAIGMGAVRPDFFRRTVQIEDISADVWQRMIAVNLSGGFFMAKAAVPIFRRQSWGRIINVTTSFFTMLNPGFSPYGPAKAGMEAWSASLASELGGSGITVNVVVPGGPADTPMVPPESGFLRERLVAPEAMAPPMLWLCTDEAQDITGQRYIAAEWDRTVPRQVAAKGRRAAGWPELGLMPVWPE
jgi:NAD(P)-dependent dehydrogenase (short-subunit alcohol dehydrogenase family)